MSSATPLPYNVRYNADAGALQYEFATGWINVPLGAPSLSGLTFTTQPAVIKPSADSTAAIEFTKANGTTSVLLIDTQNQRIGIGTAAPAKLLHVAGNTNIDGVLAMGVTNASAACLIDMVNPFVGLGIPAMTTAQKNAVSPNRAGNLVFDTDLGHTCENTGAAWNTLGTGGGSGIVRQVLQKASMTVDTSTSGTFAAATDYTIAITPATNSSRILVQVTAICSASTAQGQLTIMRNSTNLGDATFGMSPIIQDVASQSISITYIDSPATTSAITYGIGLASQSGGGTAQIGDSGVYIGSITVTELAS